MKRFFFRVSVVCCRHFDYNFKLSRNYQIKATRLLFSKVMRIKMLHYSAADRNKDPILKALTPYVKTNTFVLEIASGTGQHVTHFAKQLTDCKFQPTECDASLINSIKTYVQSYKLTNIDEPKYLDVLTEPSSWLDGKLRPASVDYCVNINMIHISPVECTEG